MIKAINISWLLPKAPDRKAVAKHVLKALVAFIAISVIGCILFSDKPMLGLSILFVGYIILGFLHYKLLPKLRIFSNNNTRIGPIGFTVLLALLASIITVGSLLLTGPDLFQYIFLFSPVSFYFCLPILITYAFNHAHNIPRYIPHGTYIREIESARDLAIFARSDNFVKFIFSFGPDDVDLPQNGNLGYAIDLNKIKDLSLLEIFKAFLVRYNYKLRQSNPPIDFANGYRWSFSVRRTLGMGKRYLIPEKTLTQNNTYFKRKKDSIQGALFYPFKVEIYVEREKIIPAEIIHLKNINYGNSTQQVA
ncbi:MAG: hypothetical protein AAFZ15_31940 [Bacteroidota bacterium]